ncbi:hypothetical protein G9A89_002421 [Geosiphon pyriformis]|nr:hypothetical protein G9A89_002421 [Geosiphon pyriformis]
MVNTHVYQSHVATSSLAPCQQHHSLSLKKKKENLSEKHTKLLDKNPLLLTLVTTAWHQAISHLDSYSHDKDKIWQIANAKIEGTSPSKILEIKNNPLEPVNIVLISNSDVFLDIKTGPEEFYKHYQNLAPTREE